MIKIGRFWRFLAKYGGRVGVSPRTVRLTIYGGESTGMPYANSKKAEPAHQHSLISNFVIHQTYIWATSWQNSKMASAPSKEISLGICPVWSESSLFPEESLGPKLPFECTAKTLIRLGRCPGWSESSLGAHATLLVSSWGSSFAVSEIPHIIPMGQENPFLLLRFFCLSLLVSS